MIATELCSEIGIASAKYSLGNCELVLGNLKEAESFFNESLERAQRVSRRDLIAKNLYKLAQCAKSTGKNRLAKEQSMEALDLSREMGIQLARDLEAFLENLD